MLPDLNTILKPRQRKYRSIARHLTDYILTKDSDDIKYTEQDLFEDLTSSRGSQKFLSVFGSKGIHFSLNNFGIYEKLKKNGLDDPMLQIDTSDPFKHRLKVTHQLENKEVISIETVLRRVSLKLPDLNGDNVEERNFILVEWFMLQNEIKKFSTKRPQLPGQDHPGLGISALVFEVLFWTGRRLNVDGILFVPNFLHTALFYGRKMLMLDPARQAELYTFDKMLRSRVKIDQLTWACAEGHLIDKVTNEPYLWKPAPITIPISSRFKDRFHSPGYAMPAESLSKELHYQITPGYHKHYTHDWRSF